MNTAQPAQARRKQSIVLLLVLAAAVCCVGLAGFVASLVYSYADGPYNSNHYSGVWVCGVAMLLAIQAACVILVPSCSTAVRPRARWWAWAWYTCWMASCGFIILVSLGIALPAQSGWAVLWLIASMLLLLGAWQHRRAAAQQPTLQLPSAPAVAASQHCQHTTTDVEAVARIAVGQQRHGVLLTTKAGQPQPELQQPNCATSGDSQGSSKQQRCSAQACSCSKTCWRRCCTGCGSCMAWSSLFWGAVLGLFLVIQAANLAHDKMAFPPPGQLVEVVLEGGKVAFKLHIICTGPITPGLATFILEGGGGSPGITMAGIADGLATSRRACWYDRLGYGWSDDAFKPTTTDRSIEALEALLTAAPELAPPPYILVGHSAGGQIAMHFAQTYSNKVAGLALLDIYSDVAIYLTMTRGAGATMATHQLQAADGTTVTLPDTAASYQGTVPVLDSLRAVTPLAWGRWITSGGKTGKYGPATIAMYGNNKEWHAQWVEVLGLASSGATLADSLTINSGRPAVWEGAGWRDFSPLPVLLLPAEKTLQLPAACQGVGSDYTTSAECVSTLQQPQARCEALHGKSGPDFNKCMAESVYGSLYAAYKATLSSGASLFVLPGDHGSVTASPETVQQLLAKFAGV